VLDEIIKSCKKEIRGNIFNYLWNYRLINKTLNSIKKAIKSGNKDYYEADDTATTLGYVFKFTKSYETTIRAAETLEKCVNAEKARSLFFTIYRMIKSPRAIIKSCETLDQYTDKEKFNKITTALTRIAAQTRSEKALMKVSEIFNKYVDKKATIKVAELFSTYAYWASSEKVTIRLAETLNNQYIISNIDKIIEADIYREIKSNILAEIDVSKSNEEIENQIYEKFNNFFKFTELYPPKMQGGEFISFSAKHIKELDRLNDHTILNIYKIYSLIYNLSNKFEYDTKAAAIKSTFEALNTVYAQAKDKDEKTLNKNINAYINKIRQSIHDNPHKFYKVNNSA